MQDLAQCIRNNAKVDQDSTINEPTNRRHLHVVAPHVCCLLACHRSLLVELTAVENRLGNKAAPNGLAPVLVFQEEADVARLNVFGRRMNPVTTIGTCESLVGLIVASNLALCGIPGQAAA